MSDGQMTAKSGAGVASVMHVRCPLGLPVPVYRRVLEVLRDVSPIVQAVPPAAALVELRGAFRCLNTDAAQIGALVRLRTAALLGVDLRIGIGINATVAATASAQVSEPGGVLLVEASRTQEWLAALPVEALHGIGRAQARALHDYGIHSVGLLAAVPAGTVQRLLGGRAGRLAAERAAGIDRRPVTPKDLPASASVRHRFTHHALDGAPVRAALLDLVVRLGALLRRRGQVARTLALRLEFAGGASWERSRRLAEASANEVDLRTLAYRLMDAAGLERARLVGLALRAEDLVDADRVVQQISLDGQREARLRAERAIDAINSKYGAGTAGPAALLRKAS
ncbi:hypothetical protein ACIG3E_32900 [Streptomyces sp. NPDC053474]|uniref:DNA polymerase Y family protein n=1 Tax=Streptomyces sp. NPDC053474 TaxID=3365704 RepID=UPI0037D287F4